MNELDKLKEKYVGKFFVNKNETTFVHIETIFKKKIIQDVETGVDFESPDSEIFFTGIVITCNDFNNINISKQTHNFFLSEPEYTEITTIIWFVKVQIRINNLLKIK